jgi:type I restriction-modification system DNA methylase subunit
MNKDQARNLIRVTFTSSFDRERFRRFIKEVLNSYDETKAGNWNLQYIKDAFKPHVQRYERLGTYTTPDDEKIDILIVYLTQHSKLERARTALRDFVADHLKTRDEKESSLVAFVSPSEETWRFSFVKMEYEAKVNEKGKVSVSQNLTPAKRYSYLVGAHEQCHTAQTRFLALLQNTTDAPSLTDIEEAFSVEAVTKEFFQEYARLFIETEKALSKSVESDRKLKADFEAKGVSTIDLAKKLLGQIVFLYFIQKKGWLGVPRGKQWGDGPRDFMRRIADRAIREQQRLFDDVLEPLFYDTLATDRGHEAWCDTFESRIPFLNGGLFEPLAGYAWQDTEINLPNSLFTNKIATGDVVGTGILDVFDRYNFTVNESEPLEKEVAIDPEMLGKVFENLIEENRRKGLGAFYTPREIVHYMCQESLINYLDTKVNAKEHLVARSEIEELIRFGEQASHYEAARKDGTVSYTRHLPKAVEKHAREVDDALKAVTVCDPAIGSGAFPVGMMTEIVRARTTLTPYFNDISERTPYYFKRHAIQNSLYGVDIDAGAVEIAKLRLWLSLVVDEDEIRQIKPLPNLDYKITVGDSLMGVEKNLLNNNQFADLEALKPKYFDESNREQKEVYRRQIETLIDELTSGREVFDFSIYFSEVFHANGGFDVVIANPPYLFARNSAAKGLTQKAKDYFYKNYTLAQYQVNLYPLFIEQADRLLTRRGNLTFITPNNWLTINTNRALREFVLKRSNVLIVNFYARVFDTADVDSAILIYENGADNPHVRLLEYTDTFYELKSAPASFFLSQRESVINVEMFKASGGEPELIAKIDAASQPLKLFADVKTGLKAYEVGKGIPPQTEEMKDRRVYHSKTSRGKEWLEYLQGVDVRRYSLVWSGEYLHFGSNLAAPRKDFRLYSTPRILVRQIPNKLPYCLHACYVEKTILNDLNSMNVINLKCDPFALLAVLNSRLTSFWFALKFGKLQRGLFPQFKANELQDFPIPKTLKQHEKQLSQLARRAMDARLENPNADIAAIDRQIDQLVFDAFCLTPDDIQLICGQAEVSLV